MIKSIRNCSIFALALAASGAIYAQEANPTFIPQTNSQDPQGPAEVREGIPIYKVQVVGRDIPAINYFHRQGSTKIGFRGTPLMPMAKGDAKVEAKGGRTSIDADFQGLTPANGFGMEYLTYVLWAITPEGRPINLGEILPTGSKDKNSIQVTTNLQAFGLIITAEPYFAVTMPSDIVVMQNFVLEDKTNGVVEQVNAHYSLLPRGAYAETAGRKAILHPITRDERSPLELYEAQNAVEIAVAAGADKYAGDTIANAKVALKNAEDLDLHKSNRKQTITYAREAVQASEDARIITIRKIKAEDDAAQVQARKNAEMAAQQSQADAEQAKKEAEAEAARRAQADADAAAAQAKAEAARQAQAQAEAAAQAANAQAEQVRERLKEQLNKVLATTETARGLVSNMSDVLFDFNKYNLKPEANEKLAMVSGILLSQPDLKIQIEGYTDNIGSDEYNQKLSQQRADQVRDYITSHGISPSNVTATGFGKADPIADNSTSAGRAKNRRVQLVVSGNAIGVQQSAPGGAADAAPAPAPNPNASGVSNPPQQ
jgi:outer membrane protein OmpA-like peptidoglycan-associated protein